MPLFVILPTWLIDLHGAPSWNICIEYTYVLPYLYYLFVFMFYFRFRFHDWLLVFCDAPLHTPS